MSPVHVVPSSLTAQIWACLIEALDESVVTLDRRTSRLWTPVLMLPFTKRKARGYRATKNLLSMLYFVAGKLQVPSY